MHVEILPLIISFFHIIGFAHAGWAIVYVPSPQGAIAWAFFLIVLPYIAIPSYWVFGPRKFYSYQRLLGAAQKRYQEVIEAVLKDVHTHLTTLPKGYEDDQRVFENLADWPFTKSNQLELLINGEATFSALFKTIEGAQDYVLLQFYIVRSDELGERLLELLERKVKEGVRVYFLMDQIGCWALSNSYISRLRDRGVSVEIFRTTKSFVNRFKINFRNHRKIVVVDGQIAFTGGHNIGDEYLGRDASFGNWRDTFVAIRGPAVLGVQRSFAQDWYWCTEQVLELCWVSEGVEDGIRALAVPMGPTTELDSGTIFFLQCISLAEKRFWISTPYFVPDPAILHALQLAALRGVEVKILIPSQADHPVVQLAGISFLEEIINSHLEIYCYEDGFLHQKAMLIDDEWASIGSANLDNRSLRLNFELMVISFDRDFAFVVEEMLRKDLSQSRRLTRDDLSNLRWYRRFGVKFCRLFAPVL